MLQNMPQLVLSYTVSNTLALLSTMPEIFYLTGSRFFGNDNTSSDWDFFTHLEFNTKQKLLNAGFKEISVDKMIDLGYDHSQFSSILEFQATDGIIQIQLIQNLIAKQRVQQLIKSEYLFEFNNMTKTERKKLWSLLLNAAGQPY